MEDFDAWHNLDSHFKAEVENQPKPQQKPYQDFPLPQPHATYTSSAPLLPAPPLEVVPSHAYQDYTSPSGPVNPYLVSPSPISLYAPSHSSQAIKGRASPQHCGVHRGLLEGGVEARQLNPKNEYSANQNLQHLGKIKSIRNYVVLEEKGMLEEAQARNEGAWWVEEKEVVNDPGFQPRNDSTIVGLKEDTTHVGRSIDPNRLKMKQKRKQRSKSKRLRRERSADKSKTKPPAIMCGGGIGQGKNEDCRII